MTDQKTSLQEQLFGTWILVSHEMVRPDGSKVLTYGNNPKGVAVFDAGGYFILTAMRSDRAKYAVGNPAQGTAEENKSTAQGTMTYFGTYSISEADSSIAIYIEASSFPNWNGANQTRRFSIARDLRTLTGLTLQTGESVAVVFKRAG
jgi:hypothetical protein